jgi:hypothetical protein
MPKGIDPKAYAARLTRAKRVVEAMDPATRAKIKEMYPEIKKEAIVKKALDPKKVAKKAAAKPVPSSKKTLMPKTTKAPAKKTPMPKVTNKPKPLTGPAAVAEIQRRTSPGGVKKAEKDAKKGIDKKYPGLYKK